MPGTGTSSADDVARIDASHVTKAYGGVTAVADVSLAIDSGEFVVLVGPSGCGKTTTLRMLAGFVAPDTGRIAIGGRDVTRLPPRLRNIGMVFQDYALFPGMTVRQNIAFGLEEHRVPKERLRARVAEMLALIRMEHLADRLPRDLSGGQQQRVALARALAYQPAVLLMDEPLAALDQKLREDMQAELVSIQKKLGITTVLVTHDQQEAMVLADRIVVMKDGRIEQAGVAADLYQAPATLFVASFIGRSNRLAGRVIGRDGAMVCLALASGETVLARVGTPDLAADYDAVCIVRPEHLHLDLPDRPNRIAVTLERNTYLGGLAEVSGTTASGESLVIQMAPVAAGGLAIPSPATATFAPTDAVAFAP